MAQFEVGQRVRVSMDGHRFNNMEGEVEKVLDDGEGGYIIAANAARYKFSAEHLSDANSVEVQPEATRETTASASPRQPARETAEAPPNAMDPEAKAPGR